MGVCIVQNNRIIATGYNGLPDILRKTKNNAFLKAPHDDPKHAMELEYTEEFKGDAFKRETKESIGNIEFSSVIINY